MLSEIPPVEQTMKNELSFVENRQVHASPDGHRQSWLGPPESIAFDDLEIKRKLLNLAAPCYVVRNQSGQIGMTNEGHFSTAENGNSLLDGLTAVPALQARQLGDPEFMACYGVDLPYMTGAMANGIASEELVIAMGKTGMLASFGAAGLLPDRVLAAIQRIQSELPKGPYAFNLIHSPNEENLERSAVELYLLHNVTTVEASAFLRLTPHIVRYRAAGLSVDQAGRIVIGNRVIAKISRREVATAFMQPAPEKILQALLSQQLITEEQASLASQVPMADDITVEADSGGHTDNRPLVCMLPSMLTLRDEVQARYDYAEQIRIGAAGGIGTPESALAAFMMGAAYVVTGSVNQACLEAGASVHTKKLLAQAEMADVMMAPAADMFEMGVKLQVLKRGTFFPMRAQKLYEIYKKHEALEDIPAEDRQRLEKQVFRKNLDDIWESCISFFTERDPAQIERVAQNPKRKMALIFRWYLGLSSRWSNIGEKGREADYQIWCGPAMGAFNDWVRGTYLEQPENRHVADIAHQILTGAAYLHRLRNLAIGGLRLSGHLKQYRPKPSGVNEAVSQE